MAGKGKRARRSTWGYAVADFRTFDPRARESYGVYYTSVEVVRYMVGALDRALRENLGTAGLRDPKVTILDPAAAPMGRLGFVAAGIADERREANRIKEEQPILARRSPSGARSGPRRRRAARWRWWSRWTARSRSAATARAGSAAGRWRSGTSRSTAIRSCRAGCKGGSVCRWT